MQPIFNWQALGNNADDADDDDDNDDGDFVPESSESSESDVDDDMDADEEEEDIAQELESLAEEQREYDAVHGSSSPSEGEGRGGRGARQRRPAPNSIGATFSSETHSSPAVQFPINFTMPSVTYYGAHAADSNSNTASSSSNNNNNQADTSGPCVICCDRPRAMAFMPCRHCSTCEICSPSIRQCPICRQSVQSQIKLYFS